MADLNIDYAKENEYLPQNLRAFIQQPNKVMVQTFDAYFTLFDPANKFVLLNNWMAAKFASGWTRLNFSQVQSGIAPRLLRIKVSKTVGKVYYQAPKDSEIQVDEVLPTDYLSSKLYETFDKSERTGRCVIALYKSAKEDSKPYLECYDAFRHELDFDKENNVIFAKMFLVVLDDIASNFAKYFIVEKRYYNSKGEPVQKLTIRYQTFTSEAAKETKTDKELARYIGCGYRCRNGYFLRYCIYSRCNNR